MKDNINFEVEIKNQRLVAKHLQDGFEIIHLEMINGSNVYLLGRENTDKLIDICTVKNGEIGIQMQRTEEQIRFMVERFREALQ